MIRKTEKEEVAQDAEKAAEDQPRPLLVEAIGYVEEKGEALDLGAGALNDTRHLLATGFKRVTAIDMDDASSKKAQEIAFAGFSFIQTTYANFNFPKDRYDLVNAQYALPFNPPDTFNEVLEKVVASLKKGGVFAGQFFGDRDSWNVSQGGKTFHTIEEAMKLLSSLNVVQFTEEDEDRKTPSGEMKRWHVFHFIAIK